MLNYLAYCSCLELGLNHIVTKHSLREMQEERKHKLCGDVTEKQDRTEIRSLACYIDVQKVLKRDYTTHSARPGIYLLIWAPMAVAIPQYLVKCLDGCPKEC